MSHTWRTPQRGNKNMKGKIKPCIFFVQIKSKNVHFIKKSKLSKKAIDAGDGFLMDVGE